MTIAVVGLGLIGGSLCKAIKARTPHTCLGLDTDTDTIRQALKDGAIDRAIDTDGLSGADLTIVALHPKQTIAFLQTHARAFRPGSLVMDVCGVKRAIIDAVSAPLRQAGVLFLGAHPMAGREFSGFSHAREDLFQNASLILTPDDSIPEETLQAIRILAAALGFSRVVKTTPDEHDRIIAFTSQLAHVVSSAYIKSPSQQKQRGFSAGSYQDLTRVAYLNEDMWTDLFLMNRGPLLFELDNILAHLTEYRDALLDDDHPRLHALLRDGRIQKEKSMLDEPCKPCYSKNNQFYH